MTEFERKRVLDVLTAKIRANEWGSIRLNQVSLILQEAGIDRSIYGGIGPKRWLGEHFPELVIDGSNGMETVYLAGDMEARDLRKIASFLETWIKSEDPVLFATIPDRLKTQCGIDYHKYAEGKGLQQWLFSTFPQFDKSEDGRLLILRAEQASPQPADNAEEIRQMHAVAFMNWWNINTRQLRQYNTFEGMKDSEIRDAVAHQMGAALLGQDGLLLNAIGDDPSRLAFPTGLTTSGGEMIYCVLEVNPRNEDGTKQHLRLAGFCYPDEPSENGLGKWLAERFALSSHRFPVADSGQLRDQIEALKAVREELLPQVEEYLRALTRGEAPAATLEQQIGGYERRWSELERMLRDFPSLHAQRPLVLHTLEEKLDECDGCAELAAQAASAMDEVITGVCHLYAANHLGDLQSSTPERDREQLHALCGAGGTDASALLALLKPYQKLLTVMKAQVYQDAEDALEEVTGHFTEISYKFATQVLIASREEDYHPLLDLDRIEGLVRQCMTVAASGKRTDSQPKEPMHADELLEQVLRREKDWPLRWLTCISALLPEDELGKALVLGDEEALRRLLTAPDQKKLEHVTMEATPFGAASRLLAVQGNRDRLAERYLLFGLQYDQERCVPVLYRLYREADQRAQFESLWNQYSKKLPYSDDDLVYWFTIRSADPGSDSAYLDELEAFLSTHPDQQKNDRLKKYLHGLTPRLQCRPAAFWSWLGVGSTPSNPFESALENNDLERIYAVLDDAAEMHAMGYTVEDVAQIRAALGQDLPAGMDGVSKALRVMTVQKNKNGTAERLLWAAAASPKAALALFDLYHENGDSASVCWLVERLSIRLSEQDARSGAYIRSLIEQHHRGALAAFIKLHPTLLYREGVLDELAAGEREQPEQEKLWTPLQTWQAAHPISDGCPFEKALAEGDLAAMRDCLAQPAQMEAWGYPETLRAQMEQALEQSAVLEKGEQAAALRIWTFQENLHRFLEGYLYRSLEKGQGWSYQGLFRLMFEEKRYREAVAYYNAYAALRSSEQNTDRYLWSLMALEQYDLLLKRVDESPTCLQHDAELARAVFQIAARCGKREFIARTRRVINLLPQNRFEESVIRLDLAGMQQLISDPSQLLELGYTREEITHFKECFGKPYPKGSDPFSVGSRVRMFLGDDRAEQFLLEAEEDPRSARILFDMYNKAERWDDLCFLYRRHEAEHVWNDHFRKIYIYTLSKTTSPQNCEEFIKYVDETPQLDKNNSEVRWLYLRALRGAGRQAEAAAQEDLILAGDTQIKPRIAANYFDLLWTVGEEQDREHAVTFAARLCAAYENQLTLEELRSLASVNGHLLQEPDRERWTEFLRQNGLEEFLWLLNCCFGFDLAGDGEKAERFSLALKARLDAAGTGEIRRRRLMLYSEYMAKSSTSEETRLALADSLLSAWFGVLTPDGTGIDGDAWSAFTALSGEMRLSPRQYEAVLRVWSDSVDQMEQAEQKSALLVCGVTIFGQICARGAADVGSDQEGALDGTISAMRDKIADTWIELFEQGCDIGDQEWQSFADFWTRAQLTEDQLHRMDAAWAARLGKLERLSARFFTRMALVASAADGERQYVPSFMNQLVEAFVSWVKDDCVPDEPEQWAAVRDFLGIPALSHAQMSRLIDVLADRRGFSDEALWGEVQRRCEKQWPDLCYQWEKKELLSLDSEDEKRPALLQQLLQLAAALEEGISFDRTDLQLLYEGVCKDLSPQNIHLLGTAYAQAGSTELAQILSALEEGDWQGEHPERLTAWFCRTLDVQDLEWIRRYARWWAPLIRLSAEDQQTKVMVDFLGLTEGSVGESYQQSVTRLLLSDIGNLKYLRCFLRIVPGLSEQALSKLEYMEAEQDPERMDTVIKECIDRGQYDLASTLLLQKMERPMHNSSVAGQLLGALYTPESLQACPALKDRIPDMLAGIQKMNERDSQGRWKNIGRAVDITCLAEREDLFFEILGRAALQDFPEKWAVVIGSLVLRGEFGQAEHWIEETKVQSSSQYLLLLDHVIRDCLESGTLSHKNELLVRSIPRNGNRRTLDLYGQLVAFAFDRGWEKECAQAFAFLYEQDASDKALVACCIQLFMADADELGVQFLYQVAQAYFDVTHENYVLRAAKSMAVIHSCLPYRETEKGEVVAHCMGRLNMDNREQLSELLALENQCRAFLSEAGDEKQKQELLLRAATGWWRMDYEVLALVTSQKELVKRLIEIYPISFAAACMRSALLYQADEHYLSEMERLLAECGQSSHLDRCGSKIGRVVDIAPPRIPVMERLLDRPVELPWLYPHMFESVLETGDADQVRSEIGLLLSIQPNFSYVHYQGNLYRLKEMIDNDYPQYQELMLQLLTQRSTDETSPENLEPPADYLDRGDYLMTVNAAEYQLRKLEQSPQPNRFMKTLNETYRQLGLFMTGQLSAAEKSRIPLAQYMNMANLLCQGDSYKDLQVLMEPCKAKWKICIRCVQELIQGQPSNILYALKQKPFLAHEGCSAIVFRLARQFVSGKNLGQNLLREENRKKGRSWDWGTFQADEIPPTTSTSEAFLFGVKWRNPAPIRPFQEDLDDMLKELLHEDRFEETGDDKGMGEMPRELREAYRSFRSIPYVVEQTAHWLGRMSKQTEETSISRERLTSALRNARKNTDRIKYYGQLIALDWNSEGSTTLCWYCVELGLLLFDEACEKKGLGRCATAKARKILYEMAPCLPGITVNGNIARRIRTDLHDCLVSYEDLSELISDCNQPNMLTLCQAITDKQVQRSLREHVLSVREVGDKMSTPMTNTERLNWLRSSIAQCDATRDNFNNEFKQSLSKLLNQQVLMLQGTALVNLKIYNETGPQGEGHLFGGIENLGAQSVANICLDLRLDGVVYQRYQLNLLEGGSMVPFDLAYEADEDQEELHYALSGKFTAEGGEEEQIMPVEGVLRLEDLSESDFHYGIYQVDVPCTEENYTERRDIQQILNMYFGPQNSFSRFPNLAIYGMKRTGKSSVLRRLEYMFRTRPEGAPYYVETSGEGARGSVLERVYFILVNQVLNKLGYRFQTEPGWEAMRQKWEAFCQKWETCPAATTPQKWGWLNEFYTSLGHEWFRDTGLVVLVDEVENLYWDYGEPDGETGMEAVEDTEESGVALYITDSDADAPGSTDTSGLWDTISNIMQAENAPVRFVLCGSDFFTNKMVLEGDNLTQLFQRIVKLSVGRMANKELNQSMRATEGEHNDLCYHERSLDYLWSITGGLPWHSKKIVNTIIEKRLVYMEGAVREIIYPSDIIWGVDRILNDPIASSDGNYGMVALTADERVLLDILTEELRTASTWISDDTLRTYFHARVGEESWEKRYERAMKTLLSERQMIKSRGKDQSGPYQFGCELYRLYNRREQPEQFVIR